MQRIFLVAVAFWGAAVALKLAKHVFGATGTNAVEQISLFGFLITFGAYVVVKMKSDGRGGRSTEHEEPR